MQPTWLIMPFRNVSWFTEGLVRLGTVASWLVWHTTTSWCALCEAAETWDLDAARPFRHVESLLRICSVEVRDLTKLYGCRLGGLHQFFSTSSQVCSLGFFIHSFLLGSLKVLLKRQWERVSVISSVSMLLLRMGRLKEALSECWKFSLDLPWGILKTRLRTCVNTPAAL